MGKIRAIKNYGFTKEAKNLYGTKKAIQLSNGNKKNAGGILGGTSYIGGSMVAGATGVMEGIADLLMSSTAALSGDKEYAKYLFKDNAIGDWHQSLTENYNPGAVMQFAGDVAHSLGQSSVFLLDAVGAPVGTVGFFGGMIGQAISGAAEKTGDVGFKEIAYCALSGAAEGVLEKALGGTGKAVKNIAGSTFKNVGKNAVRKSLFKEIMTDADGEFLEEFASEYIDMGLQRLTGVDKEASTTLKDAALIGSRRRNKRLKETFPRAKVQSLRHLYPSRQAWYIIFIIIPPHSP